MTNLPLPDPVARNRTPHWERLRHRVWLGPANRVVGWICDSARPFDPLDVRLVLEQSEDLPPIDVAVLTANRRSHIESSDGRDTACGFECRVPVQRDAVKIRVFEVGTNIELHGSPMHLGTLPRFEGFLDGIVDGQVTGWAWAARAEYRCEVDVFVDEQYISTAYAVEARDELRDAGIGEGNYAFRCRLPIAVFDGGEHEIACLYHGTRLHLQRSPQRFRLAPLRVRAAITADGVLRGEIDPGAVLEDNELSIELRLDHRPLITAAARRAATGTDARAGKPPYRFAIPAPAAADRLEIAVRDDRFPPATRGPFAVAGVTDAAGAGAALNCRRADAREKEWIARREAERASSERKSRLLVPVWGEAYVEMFCQLCLPSLLSPNNLPRYARQHHLAVTILTRSADVSLFDRYPALARLRELADIRFVAIDDILASFFDPRPKDVYSVALTFAFFRGIQLCGDEATSTDFIFWNADFLAGDGTFGHLADIVARGGRCTMAASMRADLSILDRLRGMLGPDGTELQIAPRDLVRMALSHPHPTVTAQTLNANSGQLLSTIINRLCWRLDDDVLLGRFFLLYMLHIRPERVWEDVNGPCDYAFVPEFVPSGDVVYECNSDRICIIEPQHVSKEADWIKQEPFDLSRLAKWIDDWATHEHVEYSKTLVVFNGSRNDIEERPDYAATVARLDDFMSEIYQRLGERRVWHNLHTYWRSNYRVLNREAPPPLPDRPRSHEANVARWTGYDLDVISDRSTALPESLRALLKACPRPTPTGDGAMSRWLDQLFETCVRTWLCDTEIRPVDQNPIDLAAVHYHEDDRLVHHHIEFFGCRWGPVEQHRGIWYRLLGPDGAAVLLHRVTQRSSYLIKLRGRSIGVGRSADLVITINDCMPSGRNDRGDGPDFTITLHVSRDEAVACEGRLVIKFIDMSAAEEDPHKGFGISGYTIEPMAPSVYDRLAEELAQFGDPERTGEISDRIAAQGSANRALTIRQLRNVARSSGAPDRIDVDLKGRIPGFGWDKPFRFEGLLWRWLCGAGTEAIVVRIAPEHDYEIEFEVARDLSHPDLLAGSRLEVNDTPLPFTGITIDAAICRITGRLHREQVAQYGGWLAVRLVSTTPGSTILKPRVELCEPAAGGIAVRAFRARVALPLTVSPANLRAPVPNGAADAGRDAVTMFWRGPLAGLAGEEPAVPGPRTAAGRRLGVDPDWYEEAVRSHGGRVLAAWTCCPAEAIDDIEVAGSWLSSVDREIADAWCAASEPAYASSFRATVLDGLDGSGFGELTQFHTALGRRVADEHPTQIFLRLSRKMPWTIAFEFESDPDGPMPPSVEVRLDGEPTAVADGAFADATLRLAIVVAAAPTAEDSLVLQVRSTKRGGGSGGMALIGLDATPEARASTGAPASREFVVFAEFARQFGLDPAVYVRAAVTRSSRLREALFAAPRLAQDRERHAQTLFAYYDYLLASAASLKSQWHEGIANIDLLRGFDGFAWGRVGSCSGHAGRLVGPSSRAAILVAAAEAGAIELSLECVGQVAHYPVDGVALSVNGRNLVHAAEIVDDRAFCLRGTFILDRPGNLAIGIAVAPATIGGVAFRSLMLRRAGNDKERPEERVTRLSGADTGAMLAAAAGLVFPADVDRLSDIVEIAPQDKILRGFGRDAMLYREWVADGNEALRLVFDTPPPGSTMPEPATQAWLDLVDRTCVEGLIAGQLSAAGAGPKVGDVYGLGWGPLGMCADGLGRSLSGGGDALVFIPPQSAPSYAVEFDFTADSDRQNLLRLTAVVNRRKPLRQTVSFSEDGPQLRVEIDASVADFGSGWVSLRLQIRDQHQGDRGISFRTSTEINDWGIRVRNIAVRPTEIRRTVSPDTLRTPYPPGTVRCTVPVWGAERLKTYLDLCLPAHLAPGNLAALKEATVTYVIDTDAVGRQTIEGHPLYRVLAAAVDEVVFSDIQDTRPLGLDHAVADARQAAIDRAAGQADALMLLNCNEICSDGVFRRVWDLCRQGYRSIENLRIAADNDQMSAALTRFRQAEGRLVVKSSELTRIALSCLHPVARNQFWEGPPGPTDPDRLYWRVGETAILARATHYAPIFIFPRTGDAARLGVIDRDLNLSSGVAEDERWVMTGTDEPFCCELSPPGRNPRFGSFERGSTRDIARFLGLHCDGFHLRNLERAVRIAADPVPEERWRKIETESGAIAQQIKQRLQKYVMTPWRPDAATEADDTALLWRPDRALQEAAVPAIGHPLAGTAL